MNASQDLITQLQFLEEFEYAARNRPQQFDDQSFHDTFTSILNNLRPRKFDSISHRIVEIPLRMYQEKSIPVFDCWPSVIRGLSGSIVHAVATTNHSLIAKHSVEYKWLIDRFIWMLGSKSCLEKWGAIQGLVGLKLVSIYTGIPLGLDINTEEELTDKITLIINEASSKHADSLLQNVKWRLAIWRSALEWVRVFSIADTHHVDRNMSSKPHVSKIFTDNPMHAGEWHCNSLVPLRQDWKSFGRDGALASSLWRMISFTISSVPKAEEQVFATLFSGPGVFRGSGMNIQDLAETTFRSCLFMLSRLASNDAMSRQILRMKMCEDMRDLKMLVWSINKQDVSNSMLDLFNVLGINLPASGLSSAAIIRKYLESNKASETLRALRLLSSLQLMDGLNSPVWMTNGGAALIQKLLTNPTDSAYEKVGKLVIQRSPLREATLIAPQTSWKSVLMSFAGYTIGKLLYYRSKHMLHEADIEMSFFNDAVRLIKTGTDLEKWGMLQWLCGVLTGHHHAPFEIRFPWSSPEIQKHALIVSLIKMLSLSNNGSYVQHSLFQNEHDCQWKFEAWTNCAEIIYIILFHQNQDLQVRESKHLDLNDLYQHGLVQSLCSVLSYIAILHNEISVKKSKFTNIFAKNFIESSDVEMKYNNDDTLPKLTYAVMKLLHFLASIDTSTKEILLSEENFALLQVYLYFINCDTRKYAKSIIEELLHHERLSQTQSLKKFDYRQVSRVFSKKNNTAEMPIFNARQVFQGRSFDVDTKKDFWPKHLNENPSSEVLMKLVRPDMFRCTQKDVENLEGYEKYIHENLSHIFAKKCGNSNCSNWENRNDQFIFSLNEQVPNWYCNKICQKRAGKVDKPSFQNRVNRI